MSRHTLKLGLSAVGIPPARIREGVESTKAALRGRIQRFLRLPSEPLDGQHTGEFERLAGQIAVLREQQAAARGRITELEQLHEEVARLAQETAARLRLLDGEQAKAFAELVASLEAFREPAQKAPEPSPIRPTALVSR